MDPEKAININSVEDCLQKNIHEDEYKEVMKLLYGAILPELEVPISISNFCKKMECELKAFKFAAEDEELRSPRIVRVGLIQNEIVLNTNDTIPLQRAALHEHVKEFIGVAAKMKVNILCLQEAWTMPFAFCTRDKLPWCEFAEAAEDGPTTNFLKELCEMYNMVIISPILERDEIRSDTIWNTSVVIDNHGKVLGKHRKNHIPRVGDFNESTYYMEGNTGHPVFKTEFGKIAINICYGRHHPLNWLMFGLNGAEIVFNPSATVTGFSEHLWGIEARNAAISNGYFTCAINRVGTEVFNLSKTDADGKPLKQTFGPFYGSSYVTAPNGIRTPGLSRNKEGLLVTEMDLNLCRQVKDFWGFQMTQRLDMYAEALAKVIKPDFKPQIIE